MADRTAPRGTALMLENASAATAFHERLRKMLQRVEAHSNDTPVVVSVGFLRWIAAHADRFAGPDAVAADAQPGQNPSLLETQEVVKPGRSQSSPKAEREQTAAVAAAGAKRR